MSESVLAEPMRSVTERDVDQVVAAFDAWFQSLDNDPLVRSEVAILKTFLYWRGQTMSSSGATLDSGAG